MDQAPVHTGVMCLVTTQGYKLEFTSAGKEIIIMQDQQGQDQQISMERGIQITTTERITRVETRIDTISIEQQRINNTLDRQTEFLAGLAVQIKGMEELTKAVIARTDEHTKNIQNLNVDSVNTGKILEAFKSQWEPVKAIGVIVASLILGYVFSQIVGR
jgi:predicted lysophospholipase L1 biosynthesis ABC-type transport system permease subunit